MTTPTDNFEFFLNLEDLTDKNSSAETRANIAAMREEYASEKAEKAAQELAYADESTDDTPDDEAVDWSFLEDGVNFEDDKEVDMNGHEVDDEEETTEEPEEVEIDINEDPESDYDDSSIDVDLDTFITLPDGRTFSIEELQNKALADEAFEQRENEFKQREEEFNTRYENAKGTLELATLEADRIIHSYDGWDWDSLAESDPATFAAEYRYFQNQQKRKAQLVEETNKLKLEKEAQEEAEFRAQSASCVQVLKAKIPNWNDRLYEALMSFAIEQYGIPEEEVLKWNKPSQFMMLYDGMARHKGVKKAQAVLKNAKRTGAKYNKAGNAVITDRSEAQKAKAAHDYANGKLSQADAFKFLED